MKRILIFVAILMFAASLISCGKPIHTPEQLVILIDVSASIEAEAEGQAFAAIDTLIAHRQRGDRITVIPITGDAQADTPGRVLRFEVPTVRQAYDNDLRQFRNNVKKSLEGPRAHAVANPDANTDILGAVVLAQQEFTFRAGNARKTLIILSDFIQDDSELHFLGERRLLNRAVAKQFALTLSGARDSDFRETVVYLGLLRSKDYKRLSRARRDAIQSFWVEYFHDCNGRASFMSDGSSLVGIIGDGSLTDRTK